jgi:hypothetical protein
VFLSLVRELLGLVASQQCWFDHVKRLASICVGVIAGSVPCPMLPACDTVENMGTYGSCLQINNLVGVDGIDFEGPQLGCDQEQHPFDMRAYIAKVLSSESVQDDERRTTCKIVSCQRSDCRGQDLLSELSFTSDE